MTDHAQHKWLAAAMTLVIIAALLLVARAWRYYGTFVRGSDGQMYYIQLRSLVVDHDLDLNNDVQLLPHPEVFKNTAGQDHIPRTPQGRVRDYYACGWALVTFLPFAATHILVYLTGGPANGFTWPYQAAFVFWNLGLCLLGLYLAGRAARSFGDGFAAALAVVGVFLATNLLWYACIYPIMNHAASFAMVAVLVWCAVRLLDQPYHRGTWFIAAVATFFMVTLRPPDVVLLLVLLPGLLARRRLDDQPQPFVRWAWPIALGTLAVLVAVGVQLLFWRGIYGHWVTNPYGNAHMGFHWLHPQLDNMLVSTGRSLGGWYVNPFYALGAAALIAAPFVTRGKVRSFFICALLAYCLHLYIYACWFSWVHNVGQRILINSAPLLLVALAVTATRVGRWAKPTLAVLVVVLCLWNVLLTFTYMRTTRLFIGPVSPAELFHEQWQTLRHGLHRESEPDYVSPAHNAPSAPNAPNIPGPHGPAL